MKVNLSAIEEKILNFWGRNKIFEKSLRKRKSSPPFIFYEGPPYANGLPGIHHLLARAFKDVILRYKTMKGFLVERKAGWDTHGLPTEIQAEEKLNLKTKKDIEKFGVEKFIKECKKSVFLYKKEWGEFTKRIGYWLNLEDAYITCENKYIESVWFILKEIYRKGFLYQDYRVVPYCPRCGTTLSSHEVAQGYQKITEPAIYIKFKVQNVQNVQIEQGAKRRWNKRSDPALSTYLLVWTTTPWTLPGNLAIAVNPKFTYAQVKNNNEYLILAKQRIKECGLQGKIVQEFRGKDLAGLQYNPPYRISSYKSENSAKAKHKVVPADFVSLEEGTGLVHIAPAFGEEDLILMRKQLKDSEFQIPITVDKEGKMKTPEYRWNQMFVKDADPLIIKDLDKRRLLFKKEPHSHDYPFCWRCKSPLLYYIQNSWFLKTTEIKQKLLENNKKVNWVPPYLKEGRFGQWLREVKDWNLSRSRYWGIPLPVWECKNCQKTQVIGSKKDILSQKFSVNSYFIVRHGESLKNKQKTFSCWPEKGKCSLTAQGKKQVEIAARKLKNKKIDIIFSSDLLRAKETAKIIAQETDAKIVFDKRLRELDVGIFNGKSMAEAFKFWDPQGKLSKKEFYLKRFKIRAPKGENYFDALKRMYDFLKETDKKYQNKNIVIVSHELPLIALEGAVRGFSPEEIISYRKKSKLNTGGWRPLDFKIFPYDSEMNLDFHRPYIDEVKFLCSFCDGLMERTSFVIDCWFDSGAMPFAQNHWPFISAKGSVNKKSAKLKPPKLFPADFICEGIDQTRGWFYTLLAVSTLLGFESPYKNVISVGLVCDRYGRKMSKSRGNIIVPSDIYNKFGADTARLYFYTVNRVGDSKRVDFGEVQKLYQKFFITLFNSLSFFLMYKPADFRFKKNVFPKNILDKWLVSKINRLNKEVQKGLENFDVVGPARLLLEFIDDFSNWYIRRSRARLQRQEDKEVFDIFYSVVLEFIKISAPLIPFTAEEIYQQLQSIGAATRAKLKALKSIHLENYPQVNDKLINLELENKMDFVRKISALGLKIRKENKIKVRQPLFELRISQAAKLKKIEKPLLQLIGEELNVKKVIISKTLPRGKHWFLEKDKGLKISLNLKITPTLRNEGLIREFIRQLQEIRKKAGHKPHHKILIKCRVSDYLNKILQNKKDFILEQTKAKDIEFKTISATPSGDIGKEFFINGEKVGLSIKKI